MSVLRVRGVDPGRASLDDGRRVAKLPGMRKSGQARDLVRVDEVPREAGEAEREGEDPDQSLADARALFQLVIPPEELGLLFGGEDAAQQELLDHLGQELGIAAVLSVP